MKTAQEGTFHNEEIISKAEVVADSNVETIAVVVAAEEMTTETAGAAEVMTTTTTGIKKKFKKSYSGE